MSITSDEVNLLVYRYLQESGFVHSAFSFAHESLVARSAVADAEVPPGALISFLQKGLQYVEVEAHLTEAGEMKKCHQPFSLVSPHSCRPGAGGDADMGSGEGLDESLEAKSEDVTLLHGHRSEVFTCAWHPTQDVLATGSSDATARVWTVGGEAGGLTDPVVLNHVGDMRSKDIATLDWHKDGDLLATGSYDGNARVWSKTGELVQTLSHHKGPVFSLKWNKSGTALLSAGVDRSAVVWDPKTGGVTQQFEFHSAPTLDVDWQNDSVFASCSTDRMIHVCEVGKPRPLLSFEGHEHEVNAIEWDPTGRLLASCSDDCTAKVWSLDGEDPLHDFREHSKEIYTLKWSPTRAAGPPLLATASFDATVRLWDVDAGKSVANLAKHSSMVYAVAFSPDGEYVASGSLDRYLHIWSVKEGVLVRTYKGGGCIFEVAWNSSGNKVAACFSNNVVSVVDFRK